MMCTKTDNYDYIILVKIVLIFIQCQISTSANCTAGEFDTTGYTNGYDLPAYITCWGDDSLYNQFAFPKDVSLTSLSLGKYVSCGLAGYKPICVGFNFKQQLNVRFIIILR